MKFWRIWCKALGSKEGATDREANQVAAVRTIFFLILLSTNLSITANVWRHW